MIGQKLEGLANAAEHAKRQHIDLQEAKRIYVILVPFDDGAVLHRGILDRAELVEPPLGDDEAADMLAEMARKSDDLADEMGGKAHAVIGRIEPRVTKAILAGSGRGPTPDLAREAGDDILA